VTAVLPDLPGVATVLVALVGGLVVALPLAAGAVRLSAALRDMPTEPTLPSGHLIGAQGVVVSRVPAGRLGEVRLTVAGPNQAFLVTGRQGRSATSCDGAVSRDMPGQKVVMGASVFVLRVVQKLHPVDLSSRRIPVGIRGAVSRQGVKRDLGGVAIVKVGGNEGAIRAAAQRFLAQQGHRHLHLGGAAGALHPRPGPPDASNACTPTTCGTGCSAAAPTSRTWCSSATSTTGWCTSTAW
jgi:hypothetical protein